MQEKMYNADIYLRISKEDGDKEESDSIANQRTLILDFLKSYSDIQIHKIRIDDGRSGVDFNRPAFMEMIDDIREGIVNCVIVKDFSRFGRNYIESGKYIQVMFPRSDVRFIAVTDNYDSAKANSYTDNIIVPFKNIVNDTYCADMSVKVRSHLDVKRRKGDFVGAFAVYGYAKDEENKNKLVPDDFAADVVRDIFKWKLEGISSHGIADKLNQKGILSPMEYKRFLGLRYNSTFKVNATAKWQAVSVKRILTNAVYTGVLEQGKRSKPNYKVRKCVEMPKEQWVRTENAHEPIISENIFNTVQELLKQDTRAVVRGKNVFPLSGIILCADCNSAMVRKTYPSKAYYVCSKHRADKGLCSTHTISAADCENAVLDALRLHTSAVLDIEKTLASIDTMAYQQAGVRKLAARLEAKREEIAKYNGFRLSLHESLSEGVLSKDDFVNFKKTYDVKIAEAEDAISLLEAEIKKSAEDESANHDWIGRFCDYGKVLERKTVAELIERVSVYEGGRISVTFRYHNEFSRLCPKKGVA